MSTPPSGAPETVTTEVKYQIVSPIVISSADANLVIDVKITKRNDALAGASEDAILEFVRTYLQSLTEDPIYITKIQTTETRGL